MTDGVNSYQELRAQKIARNNKRLAELGLIKPMVMANLIDNKRSKQLEVKKKVQQDSGSNIEIQRRTSPRLLNINNQRQESARSFKRSKSRDSREVINYEKEPKKSKLTPPSISTLIAAKNKQSTDIAPKSDSTRAAKINVHAILTQYLGKQIESGGKMAVIQSVCGQNLSFNKYSGICEWSNCLFLWCNIGSPDADIYNEFLEGGQKMTWFGGSNMHIHSPSIQRLLTMSQLSDVSKSLNCEETAVILWVRIFNKGAKAFLPYVCLGRVAYVHHDEQSKPLKFVLSLRDYNDLLPNVSHSHFTNILNCSDLSTRASCSQVRDYIWFDELRIH